MSSRRERPPSGRVNMRPTSALPAMRSAPGSARPQTAGAPSSSSARSMEGSVTFGERQQSARPSSRSQQQSARPQTSGRPQSSGGIAMSITSPSKTSSGGGLNALVSARSQESELSTGEVLRRMREKSEARKNELDEREIEALGDYNAFSRPKNSSVSLSLSLPSYCALSTCLIRSPHFAQCFSILM